MANDLQKTVAGALLFSVSALTGNALLMTAAGGVGVNWTSEGLMGLWRRSLLAHTPGSALTRTARRALTEALAQVEAAYQQETGQPDPETFRELRGCLTALDSVFVTQPADLAAAQRELLTGLETLLEDRPALPFVRAQLLPTAARTFRAALADDDAAWRLYHGWLIERLAGQLAAQEQRTDQMLNRAEAVLTEVVTQERALVALKASLERLLALTAVASEPATDTISFENRDLDVGGELVEAAGDIVLGDPLRPAAASPPSERPPKNIQFRNEQVKVKGNTYQTAGTFVRGANADAPRDRPASFVLTLQLTPSPGGAQVCWRTAELGEYSSAFVAPYCRHDLASVLRALEHQQHPAFALADGDLERLHALGLLDADLLLPGDLPQRVGRQIYAALVADQGLAALVVAQSQASATARPLALRLLVPPQAVELAALPWELLWPAQGLPLLLNATPSLHFTRHLDLDGPLPASALGRNRPLRILSLIPQVQRSRDDLAETQTKLSQLWHTLKARGIAEITTLSPVTRNELARAMRHQPDIVQYTGHGWYAAGRGVLRVDPLTPGAAADLVDADQIAVALRGARMVVLAACRSAQGAGIEGGSASLLTGIAPALSAAGLPLVVGMQLGISLEAALRASEALYSALAQGLSVQAAVGHARDELYVSEAERSAWYVPTLYVRSREPGPVYLTQPTQSS